MNKKSGIVRLLEQGVSYRKIQKELNCSKGTIGYHAKQLGITKFHKFTYDWKEVQKYYDKGHSLRQCMKYFGMSSGTISKAVSRGSLKTADRRIPLKVLLSVGRSTARAHLKNRLFHDGLLKKKCYECGITKWRNKPLSLNLHHINGVKNDNRLENLTLLCPNCHSQTPNFGSRNMKHCRII